LNSSYFPANPIDAVVVFFCLRIIKSGYGYSPVFTGDWLHRPKSFYHDSFQRTQFAPENGMLLLRFRSFNFQIERSLPFNTNSILTKIKSL